MFRAELQLLRGRSSFSLEGALKVKREIKINNQ